MRPGWRRLFFSSTRSCSLWPVTQSVVRQPATRQKMGNVTKDGERRGTEVSWRNILWCVLSFDVSFPLVTDVVGGCKPK